MNLLCNGVDKAGITRSCRKLDSCGGAKNLLTAQQVKINLVAVHGNVLCAFYGFMASEVFSGHYFSFQRFG